MSIEVKMVKARKNHECDYCDERIEKGDIHATWFDTDGKRQVHLHASCHAAALKRYMPGEEMIGDHRQGCWCDEDEKDCACMKRKD